ncbi:MAG: hypothetical protein ACREDS_13395 [Limisphaerales bacterium]
MPKKTQTETIHSRLKGSDLEVGGRYLHRNGLFVREIDAIEGDRVFWHDDLSSGQCGKQVFLRQCPSLAPVSTPATKFQPVVQSESIPKEFTIRDEANALTAFAFRNGFLEDLHAGKPLPSGQQSGFSRISDDEMRRLMIEASEKLAGLLKMKQQEPQKYDAFIRRYNKIYCHSWKRDGR